jgi:type III restriction enzyme
MIDSEKLIQQTTNRAAEELTVAELNVHINRAQLRYAKNGAFETIDEGGVDGEKLERSFLLNNIAARIAEETGLTRKTIADILEKSDTKHLIKRNPETYVRNLTSIIKGVLQDMQLNDGLQYIPVHDTWSLELFGDLDGYIDKLVKVEKSVYDYVQWDSEGEKHFAQNLEERRDVKVFVKLPTFFKIETPLGEYRPDWAIVIEQEHGDALYLVRETKFVEDLNNLRPSEQTKIACGKKHFAAIGMHDFTVIQKTDLSDLIESKK